MNNAMQHIKDFYGNLIDLIGFIVGKTSDQGADIAIRALPILAPLPNAISMYYVSQEVLHFGDWQAMAFASSVELALFGLFEVVLKMFDGLQTNRRLYTWPFRLACGVALGIMVLIIIVVARLEVANPILSVLPLFSAAGATALALRRWDERNHMVEVSTQDKLTSQYEAAMARIQAESDEAIAQIYAKQAEWKIEYEATKAQLQLERDIAQAKLDASLSDLERLQTELEQLQAKSEQYSLESVLSRLDDGKREKLLKLLDAVQSNRIQNAADLVRLADFNKTDAYTMWPLANAAKLVYLNGDGAYHVSR